jgi:hypothetical protein
MEVTKVNLASAFDPRNKVVSFRLSDGEYAMAQEFCKAGGFRGMSMLARSAFLAYLPANSDGLSEDPTVLRSELRSLHLELSRLISSLSRIRQQLLPESDAPENTSENYREASASSIS